MCRSAYLHVPFCQQICSYCDFTRCAYHEGLANKWLARIQEDIPRQLQGTSLDTMYIGGGTPSALRFSQLEALLKALTTYTKHCKEYTIEANVESFTKEKMELCKTYGVNRVSLGVQTLQPHLLELIHRTHTKEDVMASIDQLHACGIHNISIDLIYGLPQQTLAMWKEDLAFVCEQFAITHISLYALTIEEHSTFGRSGVQPMEAELEADLYEYAIAFLKQQGFVQYEVSSFVKDQQTSKHNQAYWRYDDFVGIGVGASGKEHHQRYDNTKNLHTYITQGQCPSIIRLSEQDEMFEMIMMSFRMKQGLQLQVFEQVFSKSILDVYGETIKQQIAKGNLILSSTHLYASDRGMLLLNDILVEFL